jgi:hypothetical protein
MRLALHAGRAGLEALDCRAAKMPIAKKLISATGRVSLREPRQESRRPFPVVAYRPIPDVLHVKTDCALSDPQSNFFG